MGTTHKQFWSQISLRSFGVLLSPWLSLYTCLMSCCTAYTSSLHHSFFRGEVRATPVVFPSLALNDASQVVKYLAVQVTGYSHTVWWRDRYSSSLDSFGQLLSCTAVFCSCDLIRSRNLVWVWLCRLILHFSPVAFCSNFGCLLMVPRYTLKINWVCKVHWLN